MTVVYQPEPGHYCGPNQYGYWMEHWRDPAGTVRECGDCGRSWVAYRPGQPGYMGVKWRREGCLSRRTRHRRTR